MQHTDTLIVGASQAGLAASHELGRAGVENIVIDRGHIGNGWHQRWDSFCLVTPNWSVQLPGGHYDGGDPDGFMPRDEVVAFLRHYARSFDAPVREGVEVISTTRDADGFVVTTSDGDYRAASLVLACGAFQKPHRPHGLDDIPDRFPVLDVGGYRNPSALPPGDVLIIGSGQSGCQIAEELADAGRRVVLACGRVPWMHRRVGNHDVVWWMMHSGFLDARAEDLPAEARLWGNVLVTGHDGGRDLHLRLLAGHEGITLAGHFVGVDGNVARFADDLHASVAWGDARYEQLRDVMVAYAEAQGMADPELPDAEPFAYDAATEVDLSSFGAIVVTSGFRPDFGALVPWQDAFDEHGFPYQHDGTSTVVDGLHFVGLHLMRKRKSGLLCGVGEDAGVVAGTIAARAA